MAFGFFDGDTQNASLESIRRKRELAAALLRGRAPRNVGEGLTAIGDGLVSAVMSGRANAMEREGNADAARVQAGFFGGPVPAMASAGNPVATGSATGSRATDDTYTGAPRGLFSSESGGRFNAQNDVAGAGGMRGHFGRVQFGQARLQEAAAAGAIPQGTTPQQFMASPDLQRAAERWHFADIDNSIQRMGIDTSGRQTINGVPITRDGLVAVAHLGGTRGMQRFVETGGRYNPADVNGTSLMDYFTRMGGQRRAASNMPVIQPGPGAAQMPLARQNVQTAPMPNAALADMPAPGANPTSGSIAPVQGDNAQTLMSDADYYAQSNPEAARQMRERAAMAQQPAPMIPGGGVPVAENEADTQFLENTMAAQQGQPVPMEAQPVNTGDMFSPVPMGGGFNPFVPRNATADMPAPNAQEARLVTAPMPPQRPADLGPASPFVPAPQAQPQPTPQPQQMPDMPQSDNDVAGAFARSGAMGNVFSPFVQTQQAQMPAQAPQMAAGGFSPFAPAQATQAQQPPQQAPQSSRSQQLAALISSPMVPPQVKQFAMQQYQQEQAMTLAQQEQAQVRAQNEAAAKAAGIDPALLGNSAVASAALKSRFDRLNNQPKRSLQPVFGVDAQGKTVMLQPGEDGTAVQTQMPSGVTIASGVDRIDAGTKFILMDKRTGQVVGEQPKDIAGVETQKEIGKDRGQAITGAGTALATADQTLTAIDSVLKDPNLGWATGAPGIVTRNVPGTPTFGTGQRIEQLQGRAFLQAFESLKGGGAITEIEGQKATQAIARLNARQSEKDFRDALQELRGIVQTGRDRVVAKSGQQAPEQASPPSQTMQAPQQQGQPARIGSKAEFDALPSGSTFIAPDGTTRRKP